MSNKLAIPTFDAALDAYEAGGDKLAMREENKLAKYNQLSAKKNDLTIKLKKQKNRLTESYHDSSMDTVQILMDLQVLEKEAETTDTIIKSLFPNGLE